MCGITGVFAFNLVGRFNRIHLQAATQALSKRGPDHQQTYIDEVIALGHRRLSIIDTREIAHQPMWDETGRYCIVFNGEIFNYRELRAELEKQNISFFSDSDTEVLLKLCITEKEKCLSKLNGFFSFCFYDKHDESLMVARDRFGVKPLLYVFDDDKFIFASEMKSILAYGIPKTIDYTSLFTYLQLNYIPSPDSIFTGVKKLMPGHYLLVRRQSLKVGEYYKIPYHREDAERQSLSFDVASEKFKSLLDASVQRRLVSDVPLGAFLSGGIDSSVITAIASRHKSNLLTFSIGFADEPFFDETEYARIVAKKFNTEHTVFSLTNQDLFQHVHDILDYTDEPFADSSAIAVYILSKETRKRATVALSGDGADELLGGYNKYEAFRRISNPGLKENLVHSLTPLWKALPRSRNNRLGNTFRQLLRFSEGMNLSSKERYWRWAGYADETNALSLLTKKSQEHIASHAYANRKQAALSTIPEHENINDILLTDMRFVLQNDMLTKVDLMSMANGLEVRTPFLDYELVNFAFSLPSSYKVTPAIRKRILQESYRDVLPPELFNRKKKGFEVPLLKWLRGEMKTMIENDLLGKNLIDQQGIFEYSEIEKLKKQLFSNNPGDIHAQIWALVVFQWWWKKYV